MIKILFFIETLTGGGAEKVLRNLVNHMDQTKFDITVQTVWPCNASKYLVPGIRYKTVYSSESKLKRMHYRAAAATGLFYKFHVKDDYDIECAFLEAGPTKIIASSTNKKAKKLAWVHCDLMKTQENPKIFEEKTAQWYKEYDYTICVSETVKESFDRVFAKRFPSVVLYNVIDDDGIRIQAEAPCQAESDHLVVLAVGTIYPPKNYPRLLVAHKRILSEGFFHSLWIIGDGQDREMIENLIFEEGLQDTVTLFGFQTNPYPFMKRADVLVCSSNYEGYSTVITEGTILGKAIVTTECSGMREILGDSKYGLITENSDEAFYQGLKLMIQDKTLRDEYSIRASKRGLEFSLEELLRRIEEFLHEVYAG